jgi:glycosyltransferase involved in cell wall biosynthesis
MASESQQVIHVLHVVPTLRPGGMELSLGRLVSRLAGRRFRHTVACLIGEPTIRDQFPGSTMFECFHSVPNEPALPLRLWRMVRRVKPTVIHARNWGAWPDVALARLLVFPLVPLVFSFHGRDSVGPMPLRRRLAFRMLARVTTCLFTVSGEARRFLVEQVGLTEGQIRVIPNGVDTTKFAPAPAGPQRERLVVGTAGSLTPVKNQELLMRSCADLLARGADFEIRVAGDGPERSRLLDLAEALRLADRVQFLGHVDDIHAFLHSLDIFVLPSHSEAHPNALLEAMACGLPCIATRVGGMPEMLDGGRAGLLVDANDRQGLATALEALIGSPQRRAALGEVGRSRVSQWYSLDQMLEAYASLYRSLSRREGTLERG